MKPNPTLQKLIPAVIAGLALACWPDAANASTATLPLPPSAIQPGGNPTDTTLDWGIFWNGYQGADGIATEVFDPNVSSSSSIPGSIHVNVFLPGNIASNAPTGAANLCFGDFITAGFGYTWLSANQSSAVDFSQYSALSFDILVNINTSSNTAIPIYLYSCWDNGNVQIGSVPIPATQGWQHISIPIPNNFSFNDPNAPPANGTAWGFHYWYPNNDPACSDFWIDNVQLVGASVIPPLPSPLVAGALRRELFLNIPGSAVTDLTSSPNFPGAPDSTGLISSFETPSGLGDNYGQRLSGYLLPPVTGNYVFYIASDDQSILYLSTDSSPANKVQIASEPSWNGPRQWVNGGNQTSRGTPPANVSSPIALQAGQAYYVEVLHKQGGGGDNLGVLWQLPGASAPANGDLPIAGAYLAYDGSQPLITSQSGNQVVVQGGTVTLSVTATGGSGNLTYQWRKDGVNLDGQTGSSLTINGAASTDTGVYKVQVHSGVVSVLSAPMAVNVYVPFDTLRGDNIGFSPDMTPGSTASLGQGNFDVTTSGYGIWDTSDVFHYSYTAVVGDFDVQARIARFDNSGWYAAAGLMVRQNLSPGSANVKVIVEPPTADNSYKMEYRASQDSYSDQIIRYSGGVPVPNAWMRLKREGNTISAYRSTDGVQWTSLGQTTQVFSDPVLVGLATSANAWPPTITTVAQYRNLQLIGTIATVGVNFPDPNLEAAVRQALGKPSGPLFAPEVAGLTWLGASQRNIANLAGLENAINLQGLSLDNNQISDLTPLAGLTRLTFLGFGQNQVTSLAPLAGLSALGSLYAWNNPISDLSVLSGFHNLVTLSLNGGTTADLSVIFRLTSLQHLELFWMNFRNLSLLQSLPNLTSLKLDGNGITDLSPLSSLVHLQSLVASFNAIQDLSPLAGLTGLTYLDAGNNQITDLSPLRGLTQLNFLSFDQNDVSDITVLDPLTTLATVQMPNNYLDVSTGQPAYNVIQDLLARGVNVTYLPQKPFPRGLGPLLARPIFVGQTLQLLFTAGDPTQAASISSATAVSSDQTLVADGSIQVSGSGSARTLSLTANPSHSGTANITITVNYSSGTPASVSGSFPVTVLPADGSAFVREMFQNIPGNNVVDLTQNPAFPKQPDLVQVLRAFEAPQNVGDNYGQRLYGYLAPPLAGPYVFYIASDDQSILYLSTDSSPANKVQIATEPAWNGPRQWITGDNQTSRGNPPVNISAPITLTAGQVYYIEALHKEAGGGDNLAVAWQLPGAPAPANGAPPLPWVPPSGVFSSDFNQFNPLWPPLGTWLNGSATTYDDSTGGTGGSGVLKLTTALPSQTSTFVIDDLNGGQPIGGFIATFKLRMGGGTTPPADGFSFNFAPDIDSAALISEEGGGSGLTVSFDTYDNGNEAPALDIDWAGQLVARQWFSGWGSAGRDLFKDPAGNPVSLEIGDAFEDVRIELKPNGTVTVQYKGLTIHDNVFLPNYAPTHGRFALAARTGGSTENQFVDDLSITTTPVSSAPASILQPPQSQTVNEQGSVTFAVLPGGGAPFTFQWFRDNVAINGATASSYTIASVSASDNGAVFTVRVTNAGGSTTSAPAVLTVRRAEVLFADNFTVSASSVGVNFEYNAGRQSGSVSPLVYVEQFGAPEIQVNNPDSPGHLRLQPSPSLNYPNLSPNHNFTESGRFSVEFDLNTGIDDDVSLIGDYWASVVIGATSPNQFPTLSDGLGVLFRNYAGYAVFDGSTFVQYAFPGASFPNGLLPLGEFHVRFDVTTANFQGSPATITMYVNGIEVPLGTGVGNEYVKPAGFSGNWITLGASGDHPTVTCIDTIDNLSVTAFPCIEASQRQPFLILGDNPDHLRVSLPPWMNQSQGVSVTLTSQNPAIAVPTGGSGGTITLNFPTGSATEQMVSVTGVAAGTTQFVLSTPDGFCVGDPVSVTVGGIAGSPVTLVNPSFEADTFTVWPGYAGAGNGAITGWSGGGGINPVSGLNPFADNGQVPDGNQVAFMQGDGSLSQTIGGFTVSAPYYLRYRENARNCCGGALPAMKATMDSLVIVDAHTITVVGAANPYHVVTSPKFFAANSQQTLSFVTSRPSGGDSTALIDFVEVIPVAGPFVRSYAPVGGDLPTDSQINIVLEDGLTEVNPSSIQLTMDGTPVSPAISKSGDLTTVQFSPPSWFTPISHHVVNLTYGDNSPSPTLTVQAFAFDVGVLSTAPGAFFVEAEDFNFGSGQHQAAADIMPYYGGAYNGLSAVLGVDYLGVAPGAPASADLYRTGEDPNVGIAPNADSGRGSYQVTSGYKVGWNSAGNWFNYTRNFPAGTYNVYGRLASGGADEHGRLDLVTSGATTPSQGLAKLGSFDAPATGSYDTFGFVPLKTDSGQLAVVHLNGEQTLRFTVLPGALDCNYFALVPAAAPSGPAPALVSVFAFNGNQVRATFDQMLDPGSALNPSHYAIAGASVTSAILSADAKTILLTVSGLSGGGVTLTVNGVVGGSGLSVPPGTSLAGSVSPLTPRDIAPAASGAAAGSLSPQSAQDFDVIGGGNNIGGNQDGFHFDYQQWSGDFDAVVHVTRLDNSGAYAIAGLMIRQNTTPGSPEASVGLEPSQGNNNNRVQLRALQDGPTTDWGFNSAASTQPWLRLKRLGNELFAYRSPDGVSWTKLGQTTQAFTDPVLVGLATSPGSFAPGATTVANYRGYTLSANPARILQIVAVDAYASRAGADPGLFKISLFGQRAAPFLISYAISGTAQNGVDYEPIPNSVTIPAGQSSVYIAIKPAPDGLAQGFKNVTLTLPPVAGAETELASATVGLFDDQPQPGYLMREVYRNLSLNGPVADLTSAPAFPNSPNQADLISSIESPAVAEGTLGEGYGQRLSGNLIPPTDGNYTFYICSDDSSELWLSTDENPAHKVLIASEPQWNPARQWTGAYNQASRGTPPSNVSAQIPLVGAQRYYIEILHKQGGGGDDLAVAWQKPGDPLPANGSDPIGSAYLELRVPLSISGLTPAGVQSSGGDFTLVVNGAGFVDGATLLWNGTARTTTVSGPRQLMAVIPASDIVAGAELRTAMITVQNSGGEISNPLAFTIGTAAMSVADSAVAPAGGTVLVSTAPSDASSSGVQAGVSAAFNHADGAGPATISAVTYSSNPAAGTLFDTGAGFVDLQVAGAQPNDSMAANFYYPSSITSPLEDTLVLLYFNGTVWGPVLSSGGASPAKDTTENLDGTVSGGRFSVVFDNTSTPPITGMGGTVFAPTTLAVASDKTPPVLDIKDLPPITDQCLVQISPNQFPTARDAVTGPVRATTADPLVYTQQGTYTVHWTYNDGNGNVSSQTQTIIVKDTTPPQIFCPANLTVPCNVNLLVPVTFTVTAADNCDPAPVVTCSPASGSGFKVGTTTVNCTASDASGNKSVRSFTVTRNPLGFTGFLSPIGGADATGGSYASPIQTSKTGSTIPVKFTASSGGSQVVTGTHRLQVVHYTSPTAAGNPIDATAQDSAITGDQFRLAGGQWIFNLDTKATGMSAGIWQLLVTLSDGSQHHAWIQLK